MDSLLCESLPCAYIVHADERGDDDDDEVLADLHLVAAQLAGQAGGALQRQPLHRRRQREQELEDTNAVVSTLEENLVGIKQQMTALYYDFAQRADTWEQREAVLKKEHVALNEERDDLRLKLRRMQDMAELLQRDLLSGGQGVRSVRVSVRRKNGHISQVNEYKTASLR